MPECLSICLRKIREILCRKEKYLFFLLPGSISMRKLKTDLTRRTFDRRGALSGRRDAARRKRRLVARAGSVNWPARGGAFDSATSRYPQYPAEPRTGKCFVRRVGTFEAPSYAGRVQASPSSLFLSLSPSFSPCLSFFYYFSSPILPIVPHSTLFSNYREIKRLAGRRASISLVASVGEEDGLAV